MMRSGIDYPKRTRTRFVAYAVFAGPLCGLALCLPFVLAFSLYERYLGLPDHAPFAFLPVFVVLLMFLPVGLGPALVTSLIAMRRFTRAGAIGFSDVLSASVSGSVLGNISALVMIVMLLTREHTSFLNPAALVLMVSQPLAVSPICAAILWHIRPRRWIGPLTDEELAAWRRRRGWSK